MTGAPSSGQLSARMLPMSGTSASDSSSFRPLSQPRARAEPRQEALARAREGHAAAMVNGQTGADGDKYFPRQGAAPGRGPTRASPFAATPVRESQKQIETTNAEIQDLSLNCELQFKGAFDAINTLSTLVEKRFRGFEQRFEQMDVGVSSLSTAIEARLQEIEHNAQTHEKNSQTQSQEVRQQIAEVLADTSKDSSGHGALHDQQFEGIEARLQQMTLDVSALAGQMTLDVSALAGSLEGRLRTIEDSAQAQEEVTKLTAQMQGEQGARQHLAQHVAAQIGQLEAKLSSLSPKLNEDRHTLDIEKLRSELGQEIWEQGCKNAEQITCEFANANEFARSACSKEFAEAKRQLDLHVSTQLETMELRLRPCTPREAGEAKDRPATDIQELSEDLEQEVRVRCHNEAEIIARSSRELAEMRKWSVEELGRLQAAWELSETSRNNFMKRDLLDCCGRMQANIDALSQSIFTPGI